MNKSTSIKELATALAQAQPELPAVQFNATNPFLKNRYADLGAIISTARPVLAKYGLSVSQVVETDDERVGVTTILMHSSGEWLEGTATMATGEERGKSAAQVAGSVVTYLRRYSLASILGMYADEDGDGNAMKTATKPAPENVSQPEPTANAPAPVKNDPVDVKPNVSQPTNGNDAESAARIAAEIEGMTNPLECDSKGKLFSQMTKSELAGHMTEYAKRVKANPNDQTTAAKFENAKAALASLNGN